MSENAHLSDAWRVIAAIRQAIEGFDPPISQGEQDYIEGLERAIEIVHETCRPPLSDQNPWTSPVVYVQCPDCPSQVPVTLTVHISEPDEEGVSHIHADPDTTDLYAHYFTHAAAGEVSA